MGPLFIAVKIRPHRDAAGEFVNCRRVLSNFRERTARRQPEVPGENIEDAGEANQTCVFSDRSGGNITQVEFALLFRGRHRANLIIRNEVSTTCGSRWVISRIKPFRIHPLPAGGSDFIAHASATSAGSLSVWPKPRSRSASTSPVAVDSLLKSNRFESSR